MIPVSERQDTVGPIARTVKDAAIVLQAISGVDSSDHYTKEIPNDGVVSDFSTVCRINAFRGARIGVPDNVIALYREEGNEFQIDTFNAALERMQEAGAAIVRNTDFTAAAEYLERLGPTKLGGSATARADFIVNIASYLKQLSHNPNNVTSLTDLRDFTQRDPREHYPDRDTAEWDRILAQEWDNTTGKFREEHRRILHFGEEGGVLGALERNKLDAVVLPASFAPRWAAMVGTPIISVPLGAYPDNTPVQKSPRGLSTMGPGFP